LGPKSEKNLNDFLRVAKSDVRFFTDFLKQAPKSPVPLGGTLKT
jgi:hypothetical protein